jgi:cytoskeleton-associated protein 5
VQVRDKYRAMMRAVCGVYPPAKVLGTFLVEAFHSKNNRSRIECMEECAAMIERHGVEHTKGARALPALVELVGSKETAIRQTALNCLASVYRHVGVDVWPMLGKCSDVKIKDTIDEKFKWTLRQMEKAGEGRPGDNYHPSTSTATSTVQSSAAHTPGRASPRHPKAAPAAAYPSGAPPAPIPSLSPPVSPTQRSSPPNAHNIPPNLRTSLVSALNGGPQQQRPGR